MARVARTSHGVVTRCSLVDEGVTAAEIKRLIKNGGLIRVHRGVFRVGHEAPSAEARYLAAVWACGKGARLCGQPAAYLFGLLGGPQPEPHVLARTERRVDGVRTTRCRLMDPRDVSEWRGVPVTTVPRTLVDIAADLAPDDLARAVHKAHVLFNVGPAEVQRVLQRRPNSPGATSLRAVLTGDTRLLLSALERRFLEVLAETRLPLPKTNKKTGRHYVDCRWPGHKLTVELDSFRFHNTRQAWQQDRQRERDAYARGDHFRRYTWADAFTDNTQMLDELRPLLTRYPAQAR